MAAGGHGEAPHTNGDPVAMPAGFIVDVQSVISREKDPTEFGVRNRRRHSLAATMENIISRLRMQNSPAPFATSSTRLRPKLHCRE